MIIQLSGDRGKFIATNECLEDAYLITVGHRSISVLVPTTDIQGRANGYGIRVYTQRLMFLGRVCLLLPQPLIP